MAAIPFLRRGLLPGVWKASVGMGGKSILETAEVVLVHVLVRGLDRLTLKTLSGGVSCECDWAFLLLRLGDFLLGEELPPPWAGED